MPTDVDIANMALGHIGVKVRISNLQTENSSEATACRTFFETVRQETLGEFAWPFASKIVALSLIQDNSLLGLGNVNPPYEYQYVYQLPSDCLKPWRIMTGFRQDYRQSRAIYKIVGNQIYTDWQYAYLEYTSEPPDDSLYPADFSIALSFKLAFFLIPSLTAGDPFQKAPQMIAFYTAAIGRAQAKAFNDEQPAEDVQSEFVRIRSGTTWDWGNRGNWFAMPVGFFIE